MHQRAGGGREVDPRVAPPPETVLRADAQGTDVDQWGDERVGLQITGQLSRTNYGMAFNQALASGRKLVADKVDLAIDISAIRQG